MPWSNPLPTRDRGPLSALTRGALWSRRSITILFTVVTLLAPGALDAAKTEFDSGPITAVEGDRIIVAGQKGTHILELIGWRPWIKEGLEVLIEFRGAVRVTVRPFSKHIAAKPVNALIERDGRETAQ